MVRSDSVNAKGEVTRPIGGATELEPNYETWTPNKDGNEDVTLTE